MRESGCPAATSSTTAASPTTPTRRPRRETAAEEALRWIPLYTAAFGPFDEAAWPQWTVVRFLHDELGLSLAEIAALAGEAGEAEAPVRGAA
ncbi:hypothetical protein SALBM135S_07276 [Streptomyces alboniger]